MATTVKWNKSGLATINRGLARPIKNAKLYFDLLGIRIDQLTQRTFRNIGARDGHKQWRWFSFRTLHPSWKTKDGKLMIDDTRYRKRPGTDGAKNRRYSANSKLLQASGSFRKSFKTLRTTAKKLVYGTRHELAEEIMRKPSSKFHRPVLFVTANDRRTWKKLWIGFYKRNLKF